MLNLARLKRPTLRAVKTKADNLILQCWLLNGEIDSSLWSTLHAFKKIPLFHFSLTINKKPASYWKWVGSCVVHTEHNYWWKEGAICLREEPAVCKQHGCYRVTCAHSETSLTGCSLCQRGHLGLSSSFGSWPTGFNVNFAIAFKKTKDLIHWK